MNSDDRLAFESLCDRYRGYLRFLADTKLDRRLRQKIDASDIVQDAMLQAYRAWDDLRGESEPERLAWLRQILIRTLLHAVRDFGRAKRDIAREQPLVRVADQSSACLEAQVAADQSSPSRIAERAEELLRVADALQSLPDAQRDAVIAFYWHGSSVAEISRELDRSGPAVSGLIFRGVRRLNALLSKPFRASVAALSPAT